MELLDPRPGDRELLAAAQLACDREVWDRCINTSDRTRSEIDMEQRFPAPLRQDVSARAKEIGLDPRSSTADPPGIALHHGRALGVGASGLMQLMPATAKWTAKKIGMPYSPALITDRDTNLRLGNAYLKLVLDDVGGSQADGRRRLQRRSRPAAQVARRAGARARRSGPRTSPSRERATTSRRCSATRLLRAWRSAARHDRALAPRPAGRPARSERAADRQRAALAGSGRGLGENRRLPTPARLRRSSAMPRNFLILGGTGFVGRSVAEKLVERTAGPAAGSASPPAGPPAPSRCSSCRRSRWRSATSTTRRRWRGCCATPTR
jgi:hypothetical protein